MDFFPECRICGSSEANINNRLFSPCLCRGSMKYIHEECLYTWRLLSVKTTSKYQCEQCKYYYHLQDVGIITRYLSDKIVSWHICLILTMLVLIVMISIPTLVYYINIGDNKITFDSIFIIIVTIGIVNLVAMFIYYYITHNGYLAYIFSWKIILCNIMPNLILFTYSIVINWIQGLTIAYISLGSIGISFLIMIIYIFIYDTLCEETGEKELERVMDISE